VLRDKKEKSLDVVVGELPKEAAERSGEGVEDEPSGDALDGISVQTLTPEMAERLDLGRGEQGIVVARVDPDSAWGRAGLRRGDVIQQVNHKRVRTVAEFKSQVDGLKKGQMALFLVNRGGRKLFVTMKMGE
ncbi:MAG: PDZ domain-containing protein, partial [Nitrospirae bacterium]|nr:PDZ domain-containing protein [Nitrospirota bacterium]